MPILENRTPFPNFRYYSLDNKGREFGVVIVKATYAIAPSGRLLIAEEQAPMTFDDECHGAPNKTSMRMASDLVPNKPNTDIIVDAVAYAPGGIPTASWRCGIGIDRVDSKIILVKPLQVTGPRQWVPKWKRRLSDDERKNWQKYRDDFDGWELSAPQAIVELPLRYEYAFGGSKPTGVDDKGKATLDFDHRNPLGRGAIDKNWTDHTIAQPAPQIEDPSDPIKDPYVAYAPESLGPIPPAWQPRRPLGGTYDEDWRTKIWPNWPPDYSFAYHHSAHPDLIVPGRLRGDERISLFNLTAGDSFMDFKLPGHNIVLHLFKDDETVDVREMVMDTVVIDVAAGSRRKWRVLLSWRLNFEPDLYQKIRLSLTGRPENVDAIRNEIRQRLKERAAI